MKIRSFILIGLSLVLGLVTVMLSRNHESSATVAAPMAKVIAAKTLLSYGDRITPANLQLMDYPPQSVPEGAFSTIEDIAGPGEERVALRTIVPGEPVLATKISGKGGRATLSTVIDKGMRAITIAVNDVKGVAGFVQVSDRVDVLLTRNDHSQTDVLLQNVKVLGIDQQAASDDKKDKPAVAKAVTLEVSPEDAQKLTLGSSIGSLSLALRNYSSPDAVTTRSLSVADLLPMVTTEKPTVASSKIEIVKHSIEILRGTDATSYDVGKGGTVDISASPPGAPTRPTMPHKPAKAATKL
jgi:pilus assembly protein CpaB